MILYPIHDTEYMVMILYPIHDTVHGTAMRKICTQDIVREATAGSVPCIVCSTQQCNRNGWLPCGWDDDWDDVWRARVGAPADDDSILYRYYNRY